MHAQITLEEPYAIMAMKKQRHSVRAIATELGHETVYLRVWRDKSADGELWWHLRQATKKRLPECQLTGRRFGTAR
ncbi:MAG: hypothetical protein U1E29_00125 [Coriobacteriia bacterium]|nr:hypothetical protein [Coriobacteriia bacterium]